MVKHYPLTVGPFPRGFHLITDEVFHTVTSWPQQGMLHVFIQHTSAGLSVNENADADVLHDFELYFNQLAPEQMQDMRHTIEGPDDMPSHIKSTLTGSGLHIPILNGKPAMGTWQGIYLCEFRNRPRPRHLIISILD
jgi:secondary thiamine-phosphate synthase enzyme